MNIEYEGTQFEVGDECPTEKPKLSTLIRHIENHGVKSFLASTKYGEFAPCVLEPLIAAGAKIVNETTDEPMSQPTVRAKETVPEKFTPPNAEDDTES